MVFRDLRARRLDRPEEPLTVPPCLTAPAADLKHRGLVSFSYSEEVVSFRGVFQTRSQSASASSFRTRSASASRHSFRLKPLRGHLSRKIWRACSRTTCLVMPGVAGVGCLRAGAGLLRQDLDNERPRGKSPLGNRYDIFLKVKPQTWLKPKLGSDSAVSAAQVQFHRSQNTARRYGSAIGQLTVYTSAKRLAPFGASANGSDSTLGSY